MKSLPAKAFTWAACLAVLSAFAGSVFALTSGFVHWTFEDHRIALAEGRALKAPALVIEDADGKMRQPWPGAGKNRVYLVDFIYTRCMSVCQVLGSEYQRMQEVLRSQVHAGVTLMSVSFDGRDTHDDLRGYAERYRASPEHWIVGTPPTGAGRLLKELGVVVVPDGMGGFVHNGDIHLIDGEGVLLGIFPYDEWEQALAAAVRYAGRGS
ncbi:SCO family protein [Noviherbaspirillum sp.]|uniref:SCO family protein n=1 Tax=Noviherbaspirillum sp. TaxID=1926288 RepID=UPI002D4E07E1|nr:SCO family protein [Noviherbaspirillum sp.]HZW23216.1 SCO family protein [Noviherbaspirillum sp.]